MKRVAYVPQSFAEKSAELARTRTVFQPDYPRNLAITRRSGDVCIASPRKNTKGCERETGRYSDSAASGGYRAPRPSNVRFGPTVTLRHGSELARHVRTGDRDTRRHSRGHRCCDCRGRGAYQLGLGHWLYRRNRGNLRLTADRGMDPRNVRRVGARS